MHHLPQENIYVLLQSTGLQSQMGLKQLSTHTHHESSNIVLPFALLLLCITYLCVVNPTVKCYNAFFKVICLLKKLSKKSRKYINTYNLPYGCTYLAIPMFFIHSYGFELPSAVISLQPDGLPLAFLIVQICLQQILSGCLFGIVFILSSFLKNSLDIEFLVERFFFQHLNHQCFLTLFDAKLTINHIVFTLCLFCARVYFVPLSLFSLGNSTKCRIYCFM